VASDTIVWFSAFPAGIVDVPSFVIILAGNTTGQFEIKVLSDSDDTQENFTISSQATGWTGADFGDHVVEPATADIQVSTTGAPGAQWRISGLGLSGTYSGSRTFSNLNPGNYSVTYFNVSGYYTPSPQTKYVGSSGYYPFSGVYYTQSLGDVTVTKRSNIQLTLFDHGTVDGDRIDIFLNGSKVLSNHTLVAPPGYKLDLNLDSGANTLSIKALNEGTVSPNTATVQVSDVVSGEGEKVYDIHEGTFAGFNIVAP
jgi:hypothetical protein